MAIGDGLCDPITMTNYGDFLFNIGLLDELDRDYFKQVEDILVNYIKHYSNLQRGNMAKTLIQLWTKGFEPCTYGSRTPN